jgi:hypothetical protein
MAVEEEGKTLELSDTMMTIDISKSAAPMLMASEDRGPPLTKQEYRSLDTMTTVSLALGETGEPHRVVWVTTSRPYRNRGNARALVTTVLADFDHDQRDSEVIIRNVEPGCDVPRLSGFFMSLGFVQTDTDPPTFYRTVPDGEES